MKETHKDVSLTRIRKARFVATNPRGGSLEIGEGDDGAFAPSELLLAAIAACTGIDVDYITAKRAEADQLDLRITAEKIRDDHGNRLVDIKLSFDVAFPEGESGDAAREVLPSAIQRSHDRLCTVGRTVEVATPITLVEPSDHEPSTEPSSD